MGKVTYDYLMTGQLEKIMGGDANLEYTWDGSLLKKQTLSGAVSGNLAIDYNDGTLDVKSMDINGTKIDIAYDIDGVPTKIGDLNLSYISKTTRLKERSVLGMNTTFSYNTFGEPKTIETSDGLLKEEFLYDGLGRISTLTRTDPNGMKVYEYSYDLLGSHSEARRNAEHYLWARSEVERNSFLWGPMGIKTIGYAVGKFWSNTNRYWTGIGFPGVIEFWTDIRNRKSA